MGDIFWGSFMEEAGSLSVAEDTAEARSIGGEIAGEICIGDAIM